ncbi:MAG: hypothetical protein RLZZ305_137 [Actinomycetota bacterium]
MTKVFVHGNPETSAIWGPLVAELRTRGIDDVVLLSPPGFGAPVPRGWGATQGEYSNWLLAELRRLDGPIDLVGHDWGAGHVYGALARDPHRVRSWAADCAGLLHPDYVWHDAAQAWQTPDVGEAAAEGLVSMPAEAFASVFGPLGMGEEVAREVSTGLDADTARCILALYRSAAQPLMAMLGGMFISASPGNGLVVIAELDHFAGTDSMHAEVASRAGADVVRLADVGHWWMLENPVAAADALTAHWAG